MFEQYYPWTADNIRTFKGFTKVITMTKDKLS